MKRSTTNAEHRKLMDRLVPDLKHGPMLGMLATTYQMQAEFFETDFLPTLLGLGAWDDRNWTSRIAMEKNLAEMEAAAILLDARQYSGRPRSLRVEIVPTTGKSEKPFPSKLHAKVTLIVHEKAVRLIVGSANLTEPGHRRNREVVAALVVTAERPGQAPLVREAISGLQELLGQWLSEGSRQLFKLAFERLDTWEARVESRNTWFVWGGGEMPLWLLFLDRWPKPEQVNKVTIVSPFWSEEGEGGPLTSFLLELKNRGVLATGAQVRLLTEALAEAESSYRPQLPASFGTFDPSALAVSAEAWAVNPQAAPEEVGLGEGFSATRKLHAKVVLFEGQETSLAYLGSANFSRHGWGMLNKPTMANMEAGLVLRAKGPGRDHLGRLIPETTGIAVPLRGNAGFQLAPYPAASEEPPWPAFLRELVLSPAGPESDTLVLLASVDPQHVHGPWSLHLLETTDGQRSEELRVERDREPYRVPLTEAALNCLLRDQEVLVRWWACESGSTFPINVDLAARQVLPIAPGTGHLTEHSLIAYYQGRVSWEELFPPPTLPPPPPPPPGDDGRNDVDTSKIQSYQVREFVEALAGIRQDLTQAARSSRPCMRLALMGSVSPVALANRVTDAANNGRTPTAAGFQLVEILACLQSSRAYAEDDRHRDDWHPLVDDAIAQLEKLLDGLREAHRQVLSNRMFRRYETAVRAQSSGRGVNQ